MDDPSLSRPPAIATVVSGEESAGAGSEGSRPLGDLKQRTRKGLIWAAAEAGARFVLQFAIMAALARLLTPVERGISDIALVLIGITLIFSQLGVGPAIVQRKVLRRAHEDTAYWVSVGFGLSCGIALFLSAGFIARGLMGMPELEPLLSVLSGAFPLAAVGVVPESLLQRRMRFDILARAELISFIAGSGAVCVIFAALDFGVWSIVYGYLTQSFLRSALLSWYAKWSPSGGFSTSAFRELLNFSGGITAARIENYLATNGDKLVVGRMLGEAATGYYGRAYQIMVAPANLIGQVIEKVLFPALSRAQDDREKLARAYRQGMRFLGLTMVPLGLGISVLSRELILVVLGDQWLPAVTPLAVFAVGLLFRTEMKLSNSVIRACGAAMEMALCQAVYMVAVVLGAYLGSLYAPDGAKLETVSMCVLCGIALCFLHSAAICRRLTGVKWASLLHEHFPGLLIGLTVALAGGLTAHALRSVTNSSIVVLVGSACVMAVLALVPLAMLPDRVLGSEAARVRAKARAMFKRR